MDADTKSAIAHPSLKLVAGVGILVLAGGLVIWGLTHKQTAASSTSAGLAGQDLGAFSPSTVTVNAPGTPAPTTSSSSSSSSTPPPTSAPKPTAKPPVKKPTTKKPAPKPKKSTPTHTSHPAVTASGQKPGGGSSSSASSKSSGSPQGAPVSRTGPVVLNTPGNPNNPVNQLLSNAWHGITNFFGF